MRLSEMFFFLLVRLGKRLYLFETISYEKSVGSMSVTLGVNRVISSLNIDA